MKKLLRELEQARLLLRALALYGMFFVLYVGWGQALRLGALKLNWTFSIVKMWLEVLAVVSPF